MIYVGSVENVVFENKKRSVTSFKNLSMRFLVSFLSKSLDIVLRNLQKIQLTSFFSIDECKE
jgi:hypothetical protein